MIVTIKDQDYNLVTSFKTNEKLRNSYNALTEKVFQFNFEQFYQDGYWEDFYIPYSLILKDKIVANVSISIMDFSVLGKDKRFIQIGTVMTDPDYRGLGLSRYLMSYVLSEWRDKCDLIFLFANKTVLDFYPKFGFKELYEYESSKVIEPKQMNGTVVKLDMSLHEHRSLVVDKINSASSHSSVCVKGCSGLVMFYCVYFMSDNVYYIGELDTVVIAVYEEDELHLKAVYGPEGISFSRIINEMSTVKTVKVVLGFTPAIPDTFDVNQIVGSDDTLFVLGNDSAFLENKFMLPAMYHT